MPGLFSGVDRLKNDLTISDCPFPDACSIFRVAVTVWSAQSG
jgi:hypothetical protein